MNTSTDIVISIHFHNSSSDKKSLEHNLWKQRTLMVKKTWLLFSTLWDHARQSVVEKFASSTSEEMYNKPIFLPHPQLTSSESAASESHTPIFQSATVGTEPVWTRDPELCIFLPGNIGITHYPVPQVNILWIILSRPHLASPAATRPILLISGPIHIVQHRNIEQLYVGTI